MNIQPKKTVEVPTMADCMAKGELPEILFWVGCAGAFDERYKKVTQAFVKILDFLEIKYAVLGTEESCTGDPARRAGNEFLFQMQALANIEVLNGYQIKKIVTACPHCFNTLKNEYPDLGGTYEVLHHSTFLNQLIQDGRFKFDSPDKAGLGKITYHDSCYLGRGNQIYEDPRQIIESLKLNIVEMSRNRSRGLCCGAGGAQMFKDAEPGNKEVNTERTEEALETGAQVIATACPFCMTMMSDGIKTKEKDEQVQVLDLAELIAQREGL